VISEGQEDAGRVNYPRRRGRCREGELSPKDTKEHEENKKTFVNFVSFVEKNLRGKNLSALRG
jgi:hypothetical protein